MGDNENYQPLRATEQAAYTGLAIFLLGEELKLVSGEELEE